jgi:hypothetical protein
MAGQPFKLANGSGGLTTFAPTVGTAILTANEADLCAVGASGEIIAPTVDTVFVAGGTVSATTITNLTEGVTGVVPGIDMYNQRYQGAIKGSATYLSISGCCSNPNQKKSGPGSRGPILYGARRTSGRAAIEVLYRHGGCRCQSGPRSFHLNGDLLGAIA